MIGQKNHRHPTQTPLMPLEVLPLTHSLDRVVVEVTDHKSNREPIRVLQYNTQNTTGQGGGVDKLPLRFSTIQTPTHNTTC